MRRIYQRIRTPGQRVWLVIFLLSGVLNSHGASAVTAPRTCLVSVAESCLLNVPYRYLEISSLTDQADQLLIVIHAEPPSAEGSPQPVESLADRERTAQVHLEQRISVLDDLRLKTEKGEMTEDQSDVILSDLKDDDGTSYRVPEFSEMIRDLGFPEDAKFAPEDYHELARTHLQVVLDLSAITAGYLADHLGIKRAVDGLAEPTASIPLRAGPPSDDAGVVSK